MIIPMRVAVDEATVSMAVGSDLVNLPFSIQSPRIIPMSVAPDQENLAVDIAADAVCLPVKCTLDLYPSDYPEYEGPFEFTPNQEIQVVSIKNQIPHSNLVINPIPNNYGLITWNGSVITVS